MAKLSPLAGGTAPRVLVGNTLIGRSSICDLRLNSSNVSKQHAVLTWTREGWTIRDLNSRNGTFVDMKRLRANDEVPLRVGTQLSFGTEERWVCLDLDPPLLRATTVDDGPERTLTGQQLLAFGEGDRLDATLSRDVQGRWVFERGDVVQFVNDGDELEACDRRWILEIPSSDTSTELTPGMFSVLDTKLRFIAPPDQPVQVLASVADQVLDLKGRGHHHLTLELARVRLADQRAGRDKFEAGWVSCARVQELLECTRNLVNVNVHRARKQLEEYGYIDAANLVERRQPTGLIRIGVSEIEIAEQPS